MTDNNDDSGTVIIDFTDDMTFADIPTKTLDEWL